MRFQMDINTISLLSRNFDGVFKMTILHPSLRRLLHASENKVMSFDRLIKQVILNAN